MHEMMKNNNATMQVY